MGKSGHTDGSTRSPTEAQAIGCPQSTEESFHQWASFASRSSVTPGGFATWRSAAEIKLTFTHLPAWASPQHILKWFGKEGDLSSVEIYVESNGDRTRQGRGCIRFSPPPARPFWELNKGIYEVLAADEDTVRLRLELSDQRSELYRSSDNTKDYPQKLIVIAESLGVGFFTESHRFKLMRRCSPIDQIPIVVEHDLKFHEISITFPVLVTSTNYHQYRLVFSQMNPMRVWQENADVNGQAALTFALDVVPEFGVKHNDETTYTPGSRLWSRRNAWFRVTDLFPGGEMQHIPTTLRKPEAILDLGRWRVYRLNFDISSEAHRNAYQTFCSALEDFNTPFRKGPLEFDERDLYAIWDYIDGPAPGMQSYSSVLADLHRPTGTTLPFPVRYQLEVCFSENLLNEYTIPRSFVDKLDEIGEKPALALLEEIHADSKPIFDHAKSLGAPKYGHKQYQGKIPSYCTAIRSAVVTPTTVHYAPPSIEISNRVIRRYAQYSDRFLRVRFTAERHCGRLYSKPTYGDGRSTMDDVYERIRNTMQFGIDIGNRHYDFLAYGNSQFREYGAYFFAPLGDVTVDEIRKWMGSFNRILSVSKYAARLGQCFSTTRPIHGVRGQLVTIPDIKTPDGKYNFTDGVGRISKALVQIAASETGMLSMDNQYPSVLQFRLGGCKGVLTVSAESGFKYSMRESQYKFHAQYEGLEVVRWSQFSSAHLNRQFISVLSTLGVPDKVFIEKSKAQIADLNAAMINDQIALECLQREVDPNQMTTVLSRLIREGFQKSRESFVMNVLELWRAAALKKMKESARIPLTQGACLLGCIDEHRVLSGHFDARTPSSIGLCCSPREDPIPEVFVQVSSGRDSPRIIEGPMLLARNPSLHPGDIRVVRGVDKPALHYLKDVVVLPQTGDRDLASMCSGGDLDGDEYVVIWDTELLPKEWNHEPMDYTAAPELRKASGVTISDVISFFVTYMKNNTLGTIANAHLALADQSSQGVKEPKCIELAMLHSRAVDFPKSGQPAQMNARLAPKVWPHYMVSEGSRKKSYRSQKVLGQLFDLVDSVDFAPRYHEGFNIQIIECCQIDQTLTRCAAEVKQRYDTAIRRVMAQYEIATDLEVWSTFVLDHDKRVTDFKMHSTIGEHAASIKETFRAQCYEAAGGRQFDTIGPFVAAMYKITRDEVHAALGVHDGDTQISPMAKLPGVVTSFPWIFPEVMIRLAKATLPGDIPVELAPIEPQRAKPSRMNDLGAASSTEDDMLETEQGPTQRGDELVLFEDVERESSPVTSQTIATPPVSSLLDKLANM